MFYCCSRCANIKKSNSKDSSIKCDVCNSDMKEVPGEYLMPNGNFFKSQEIRNRFVEKIKLNEEFDETTADNKDVILTEKKEKEQAEIKAKNEEMEAKEFHITCPVCGSHSVKKIFAVGKYGKVYVFGLLGADTLGKTYKCNVCGAKF